MTGATTGGSFTTEVETTGSTFLGSVGVTIGDFLSTTIIQLQAAAKGSKLLPTTFFSNQIHMQYVIFLACIHGLLSDVEVLYSRNEQIENKQLTLVV